MGDGKQLAIITGGSSGIGLACAHALIETGRRIHLVARSEERLRAAASSLGVSATWCHADVGRRSDVERAIAGLEGGVDILVSAAGFLRPVTLSMSAEEADENWEAVIDGNLKSAFLMAHAVAPLLRSGGRIINISSIGAQTGGSRPGALAYAAAKAGIHGLTYALARELAPKGVRVNAIAPGFIAETGLTGGWLPERVVAIVGETPLGRAGVAADVAGAVQWLASEAASFVTGAVIPVNGGWRIG